MPYIGVDVEGVQSWKGQLDAAHQQIIDALNNYKKIAAQNNDVAHGSNFQHINTQCDDITSKHLSEHHDLHSQYSTASDKLVQGVMDVAGH